MSRFFVQNSAITDGSAAIIGADAYHIARSLRMAVGEKITVCDEDRNEYLCELTRIRDDEVTARILSLKTNDTELPCRVRLYQSLAKGEKMDYIIQKAVELGADTIVPVASARCILKLDRKGAEQKCARWQKIAEQAAKQSGRGVVPRVLMPASFSEALSDASAACSRSFFCYEGEGTKPLKTYLSAGVEPGAVIGVFIGPEGGYEPSEFSSAVTAGLLPTGLGKRILRCETASGFFLSCLIYQIEL